MATVDSQASPRNPWLMEAGVGGDGEYVLCPAGNYPGTIIAIIDIGHHDDVNKNGKQINVHRLIVAFGLAKKRPDGKPYILVERYTWSMSDVSNFYKLACGVTGTKYKTGEQFDPRRLAGMPCMIQVTNSTKGEKVYHNIAGAAQFPEGLPPPIPTCTPLVWSVFDRTPIPDTSWIPYVYGDSVASLIESSDESKAGLIPPDGELAEEDKPPF